MDWLAVGFRKGVTIVAAAVLATIASAAEPVADAVPVIEHVALFKNGLGYIRSSVVLPEGARTVRLGQLPIPCHGTFWISHDPDVPVRGELRIANRLTTGATLEVTKELSGELLQSDPKAGDVVTARGLGRVNPRHVLTWEVTVEAGAEATLTYTYQVYVRD